MLAQTLGYPKGGGHFWCYYNWALGFLRAGCRVIWLETVPPALLPDRAALQAALQLLHQRLATVRAPQAVALATEDGLDLSPGEPGCWTLDAAAAEAAVVVNFRYGFPAVGRFRRSVLMDIDPGLLQYWMAQGYFRVARHDCHITVGGNVRPENPLIRPTGLVWERLRPAVALDAWSTAGPPGPAFTAISHWEANEYVEGEDGAYYANTKRAAFLPLLDLPRLTPVPLELALCLAPEDAAEAEELRLKGWRLVHSHEVAGSPVDYRRYVQGSAGEFGVAKPAYVRLQTGWISDRTVCYLAAGRPVVVEDTGPVEIPVGEGFLRFRSSEDAARALDTVAAEPGRHSAAARQLAETWFDAGKLATRVLELALP